MEQQIQAREEEIARLNDLFQGGQQMERLNLQYVNDQNQKQLKNLENQVNFLNKDNRKLQEQNDFLKGDGKAVERLQQLNRQLDDLAFENKTLKEDLKECTTLLKNYQLTDREHKEKQSVDKVREAELVEEFEQRLEEVRSEKEQIQQEYEKATSLRAAYNADREAFVDKVKKLQREIEIKEIELKQKEEKERLSKQDIEAHRNEINFWNGKCSTLKRDLEYFERYNT